MFDAVVVTLGVDTIANRSTLVVRIKEHAPVHCALTSSLSSLQDSENSTSEGSKRATAHGDADQISKKKKRL
jgi:hypothetical protein